MAVRVDLLANKEMWIASKPVLQEYLRVIRLLPHRDNLVIILDQENLFAHWDTR